MESFKIALVQQHSLVKNKQQMMNSTIEFTKKAKAAGASLVCFPELNLTGHVGHVSMIEDAEEVPAGNCVQQLIKLAADLQMYICAGIAELDKDVCYNTQFLIGPEGFIGKQRKLNLAGGEYFYFRAGTNLPVFNTPLGRIGIIICFDNNFPETSRSLALKGAELLLCPHACTARWMPVDQADREDAVDFNKSLWMKLHPARADDNGCYVALCNSSGISASDKDDVQACHAGSCMVFDPNGNLTAQSLSKDIVEEVITVDLDGGLIAKRRQDKYYTLKMRRPEIYKILTEPTE